MGRPIGSKNKSSDNGETGVPLHNTVSGEELYEYIERIESLNIEIKDLTADRRAVYLEMKEAGLDAQTVRAIVSYRAMDADKRHARDELLNEYMSALGDFAGTPLGEAGADRVRTGIASGNLAE